MINISLFKFSRYFFALFILIMVIPLISILFWSDYILKQNMESRQAHMLSFIGGEALRMFRGYLASEESNIGRIVSNNTSNTLSEYKTMFGADTVLPLPSPEAGRLLSRYSLGSLAQSHEMVAIDYFVQDRRLKYMAVVPKRNGAILIVKTVPVDAILPPGPIGVSVFAGKGVKASNLIFIREAHFPPFDKGPGPQRGRGFFIDFRDDGPPPIFGEFPPRHPGPPPGGFHLHHWGPPPPGHFHRHPGEAREALPPEVLQRMKEHQAKKLVYLKNSDGRTVVTFHLIMFMPMPPMPLLDMGRLITLFIILTGVTTSLLAGRYLQTNFIEPLARLSVGTRKVQSGDLSVRLETEDIRQPDVRQTLDNFNHMLAGLLEKEQLRNNFISNLTHDFRTPLVAQTRSLEILSSEFGALGLSEQQQLAQGILKNNQHLLMMVNQLLETYQTEAGMIALDLHDVSMPELAVQCFEQLSSLAAERNITFTTDFSDQFPVIQVDPYYLKRVLINLLGNAIDNIPKGCKIQINGTYPVSDTLLPNMVEIHVKDNGPGISEQDQKHLFERYYVGGDTRKLGSGLGLYVCAVLIAAHQGTIQVHSVPGGGTDFIIRIPVSKGEGYGKTTDNGSIG